MLLARKMMTGADLAAAIGRSPMYVSRRVRGEVAFDLDDMERLAGVFGVEVSDLLPKPGGAAASVSVRNPHVAIRSSITHAASHNRPHGRDDSCRPESIRRTARIPRPDLPGQD